MEAGHGVGHGLTGEEARDGAVAGPEPALGDQGGEVTAIEAARMRVMARRLAMPGGRAASGGGPGRRMKCSLSVHMPALFENGKENLELGFGNLLVDVAPLSVWCRILEFCIMPFQRSVRCG